MQLLFKLQVHQAPTATIPTTAADPATTSSLSTCEVCLIASPAGVALVPCGHARFCTACVDTSVAMGALLSTLSLIALVSTWFYAFLTN